jgi:hypothetical protein
MRGAILLLGLLYDFTGSIASKNAVASIYSSTDNIK